MIPTILVCIVILANVVTLMLVWFIWDHLQYAFKRMDRLEREITKMWQLLPANPRDDGPEEKSDG